MFEILWCIVLFLKYSYVGLADVGNLPIFTGRMQACYSEGKRVQSARSKKVVAVFFISVSALSSAYPCPKVVLYGFFCDVKSVLFKSFADAFHVALFRIVPIAWHVIVFGRSQIEFKYLVREKRFVFELPAVDEFLQGWE